MDKKRENILFPLGFNSLPITAVAYNMRIKTELKEEFDKKITQLEADYTSKLEIVKKELEAELKEKLSKEIYNEVYEKLLERISRHDCWEIVKTEP